MGPLFASPESSLVVFFYAHKIAQLAIKLLKVLK